MKMDEFTRRKLDHFNETSKLFTEPCFSDLQVTCGARTWNIHKNIVCPRSKFFQGLCNGRFKESMENRIALDDDDPDALHAMLEYLYTADYTVPNDKRAAFHAAVAVISDKYNLVDLVKLASTYFTDRMDSMRWSGSLHIDDIARAVVVVYNGPEGLYDLRADIIQMVRKHVRTIFPSSGEESGTLHDVVEGLAAPGADLFLKEVRLSRLQHVLPIWVERRILRQKREDDEMDLQRWP